ncbi:PRC-barrel domain containing protein [Pedobacter polaris]|uniref:PRC-barrel domain containing protein n=1 Tax=Pedobacter polaris TaxID=2571273 RepID=A0A4U1CQE2_9SPHI|nr:PRC-barrel domain-containing protein [Pedobacter polaris]TKC09884.1 PRC-barrel domain containing protein [Pedobacter polaris]
MENNTYSYLQSLQQSDIPNPKQDVIGWEVKNEAGAFLGKVTDLLYDTQAMTVRYLVIDLTANGMNLEDKKVMIPVGIASLHPNDDEIILPNLHIDQFTALPAYNKDEIGSNTEQYIRNVIGSPAALRLEETIAEFDQQQFYAHHHFDDSKFYKRNKTEETIGESGMRIPPNEGNKIDEKPNQNNGHLDGNHSPN